MISLYPIDGFPTPLIALQWPASENGTHRTSFGPCHQNARHVFYSSQRMVCLNYALQGLSGRALRRLPVLAHARAISRGMRFSSNPAQGSPARSQHTNGINGTNSGAGSTNGRPLGKKAAALTVEQWIKHMDAVVRESRQQLDLLV
jgi:hypothetical protein